MIDGSSQDRSGTHEGRPAYRDSQLPVDDRVADLVRRMSLEEKVAQSRLAGKEAIGNSLRDQDLKKKLSYTSTKKSAGANSGD